MENIFNCSDTNSLKFCVTEWTFIISLSLLYISFVLGCTINPIVLLTIAKTPSLRSQSINAVVANLCIADLINLTVNVPLVTAVLLLRIGDTCSNPPVGVCRVQAFFDTLTTNAQLLIVSIISYERYHSIADPFQDVVLKRNRVLICLSVTWSLSLALAIITVAIFNDKGTFIGCTIQNDPSNIYYIGLPMGIVNIIYIAGCYTRMMVLLHRHVKKMVKKNNTSSERTTSRIKKICCWLCYYYHKHKRFRCQKVDSLPDSNESTKHLSPNSKPSTEQLYTNLQAITSIAGPLPTQLPERSDIIHVVDKSGKVEVRPRENGNQCGAICMMDPKTRERGKRKLEARIAKRTLIMITFFLMVWLPLPIIIVVQDVYNATHTDAEIIAVAIATTSTALNPVMYGLAIKQFRTAFKNLLQKCSRRQTI